MRFDSLRWVLVPAIAVHNFEEWIATPYFPHPCTVFGTGLVAPSWQVMEIALAIVTLLPAAIVIWAATGLQQFNLWDSKKISLENMVSKLSGKKGNIR